MNPTCTAVESMSSDTPNVVKELRFNLNQLRLLRKSVSKTLDAEAKKLHTRLSPHSKIHATVKEDYLALDEVAAELDQAINELVSEL